MSFGEILKQPSSEGKEKHTPVIEIDTCGADKPNLVRVIVGKDVPHPNTIEHHIAWIELYGVKENGQVIFIGRSEFAPSYAQPNARFFCDVSQFKAFHALEYCNIHGVWENSLVVPKTAGGCACCGGVC